MENSLRLLEKVQNSVSFRNKIFIFILVSMGLQLAFIGANFRSALLDTLEHQVGTRALVQAEEIASDPYLIKEVEINNVPAIEEMMNRLRKISDASFIVIGDKEGIRLSHPVTERIGLPMKGQDNDGALQRGESYISISEGSLGYSVRGKTPILDSSGSIIGVVSVGYLIDRFDEWLLTYATPLLADFSIILIITLVIGWLFSTHIKRNMNGMEPAEIAMAFHMQKSILKSVYEGLIAIDKQGKILIVNNTARELMGTDKSTSEMKKRSITDFIKQTQFFFHTPYDENLKDEMISINGTTMIANRVAIFDKELLVGWVVSFRRKEDISSLTEELTQVKQYTENLRVMRHEHENKLSTISGLIEMGFSNAALSLINNEKDRKQETTDFISSKIQCKVVAGILIGKATRARSLGLDLQFDPKCQLSDELNEKINPEELSAIIGNLLDNAFEATLNNPDSNKLISLLISDKGKELVIEVKDNGTGIDPALATSMFTRGVTSKGDDENNGIGLYLINRYVNNAGGVIMVDDNRPKGTVFSIFIPNNIPEKAEA
ncbi:sensor histidine kinase [Vibrio sp. JC009]|uniref:ATP-binding protein n=1 Tax=Vibrio sp. JC009 TaxID=2912314 RepID=UPI0023B11785|nr:sensor histidine kinase [Vibrio sp. JC009]WED23954.1 sensor histidine kinase [Vibrio sp. JC009]